MNSTVPHEVIRVFLLIENRLLREALARLLRKRPDFMVVGQTSQADLALPTILQSNCDVMIIGSFQAEWLPANLTLESASQRSFKIVLIGLDADEKQFLDAVRAGVTGCLLKDASASDVVSAVRAVFRGEAVCPPVLCNALFRFVAQKSRDAQMQSPGAKPDLTLRQQQLVALVAKGLTNKEIAAHLNLSEYTVRNHIHRILKQVDAESRSEAVDVIRASGYQISA